MFFSHINLYSCFKNRIHLPCRYSSKASNRGYLADPREVAAERLVTAQKYGYDLPPIEDPALMETKDPRQVFYGLEPGWVVNLAEKCIYKPKGDKELDEYYKEEKW